MEKNNKLAVTYEDRFPPEMFDNNTVDLMKKGADLGLDQEAVKVLNRERYLRNLSLLQEDGMKLEIMPIQTIEMVLTAIYQNPRAFIHSRYQTEEICEYALRKMPALLKYVKEQTEKQIEYAIKQNAKNVFAVHEPQTHHYLLAVERNFTIYRNIPIEDRNIEILKRAIEVSSTHPKKDSVLSYLTEDEFTPEIVEFTLNEEVFNLYHIPSSVSVDKKWVDKFAKKYPQRIDEIKHHLNRDAIILAIKSNDFWNRETKSNILRCFNHDNPLNEEYLEKLMNLSNVSFKHWEIVQSALSEDDELLFRMDIIKKYFDGEIYLSDIPEKFRTVDHVVLSLRMDAGDTRRTISLSKKLHIFHLYGWLSLMRRIRLI